MKHAKLTVVLIMCALLAACATAPTIDTSIKYRSQFNALLSQFNLELAGMPLDQQKAWAQKAAPFVQTGATALDMMDITAGAGGTITPENLQQFMTAKNALIDLVANLVLSKKGK